jgi:hypothetical protein
MPALSTNEDGSGDGSTGAENMYVHSASGHRVAVEMVGLGVGDKLRKHQEDLSRLPAVYVNDACVDTVGRPGACV